MKTIKELHKEAMEAYNTWRKYKFTHAHEVYLMLASQGVALHNIIELIDEMNNWKDCPLIDGQELKARIEG